MRHPATIVLALTLLAGFLAGCSSPAESDTPPSESGNSTGTPSASPSGVPHVVTSLDTTTFQAAPCTVLNESEMQSLGFTDPGKVATDSLGPACRWSNVNAGVSFNIGFVTANKDGLGSLYRQRASLKLFQEISPVGGYPAIIYGSIDSRSSGTCNVDVGVSDTLNYDVAFDAARGSLKADPCGAAERIAGLVMGHLKGGS